MHFWNELFDSILGKVIAGLIAPALVGLIYAVFRRAYKAHKALKASEEALKAVAREKGTNGVLTEGPGFWLKLPIIRPTNYADLGGNSIPILMIAATKGGSRQDVVGW